MLIAIDGRCAAGKTTLSEMIKEKIPCDVIHMDHFFLRPEQRTEERLREPGGNVDYERFLEEVMQPLRKGDTFLYRVFDCRSMGFSSEICINPGKLTIVEGSYSCHPKLWEFYDLHVFMDIDAKTQKERIRNRDGEEKLEVFQKRWIPMEENYFENCHIRERCEYVRQGTDIRETADDLIHKFHLQNRYSEIWEKSGGNLL